MKRKPYVAGNWKMWGTRRQARDYFPRLLERLAPVAERTVDVGICAPFTALDVCVEAARGSGVRVLAQNMHQAAEGAHTGEISAAMLTELGVDGVVLGHSERRRDHCENDRALREKLPVALAAGLEPILCVGETEEEREQGETERRLRQQVWEALEDVPDDRLGDIVIAYEPVWAIGTGRTATPDQAQEAIAFIRALVADRSREAAAKIRILYGGSVKPDNAADILAQPDVDGALVGGASLDPVGFATIVAAAEER
ncbi:triose-phosphate isomerase [Thermoleophilum album]|jgi:triosephosphate isomerase|uniref:triose-phosphate isomerase n=1 Tax=Thermoleophilum album TaxID=29539 RepID=UPI00237CC95C|nr:triose-phosphate isomerase [Thermoleophilum album]WDT94221.1 triose-phosphate isomerase [Thermoleophilum album]